MEEDMLYWQRKALEKYGFYVEYVSDDPDAPNRFNCHTHGIEQSFGHPDFQICLPASQDSAMAIFHALVRDVKTGTQYQVGKKYPDILGNGYLLEFIKAKECGRDVLRLLIPNKYGKYEGEVYANQFMMLAHNSVINFSDATRGGVDLYG
jgi:hypothetical protein